MTSHARNALHLAAVLESESRVWIGAARWFSVSIGWTTAVALAIAAWLSHWPATLPAFALYALAVIAAAGVAHQVALWRAACYRREAGRLRAEAQEEGSQ